MAEFISTMTLEVIDPDTGAVTGRREIDLRNGIILSAAPTTSTAGRVGMSAYVVSGGAITAEFVCTGASGGVYTWVKKATASGGGEDSIFVAVYNSTQYSEIKEAYDAGKIVFVQYNDSICNLLRVMEDAFVFIRTVEDVNMLIYARQLATGDTKWYFQDTVLQTVANMTTTISDTPSNDKYPSEKAVREFVESQTSSGKADSIFAGKKASFYGDSLTEENQHYTKGYHKWVQEILGLKLYNNYGHSGDETDDTINKVSSVTDDADIIFVMIGVNDMINTAALGTFEGLEDGTVYGNLNTLCVKLREKYPTTPIVFITPTEQTKYASSAGMTMYDVAKAVREVCVKNAVVYYDNYTISGISPANIGYWTKDDLHWNDKAHEMVGKNLAHFVKDTFHYLADSEETESSTFEGKTMTMTGYSSDGRFHFTAIVPVDEDFAAGNKVRISLQGTDGVNVKTNNTTNLQIYGDDTGICSNNAWEGQYSGKVANNLTVDSSGNISAENEYTLNAAPTTTNIKVSIAVGIEDQTANASFVIQSLAVTVNGKEKEILNVGGFFEAEKYTIADTEAL